MREVTMYVAEDVPDLVPHEGKSKGGHPMTVMGAPIFDSPEKAMQCEAVYQRQRFIEEFHRIDQDWLVAHYQVTVQSIIDHYKTDRGEIPREEPVAEEG